MSDYSQHSWEGIVLTVIIELAIALSVVDKDKWSLMIIAIINIATQLILNILLYDMGYIGFDMLVWRYILYELIVFAIEAGVYMLVLPRIATEKKKIWVYARYAAVANVVSFVTGLVLENAFSMYL